VPDHYWDELGAGFERVPRYNIAPTMPAMILRLDHDGHRVVETAQWGLLPFWAQNRKLAYKTFNARAETVREKPSFREAFKSRRCFVLASGYYEWQELDSKNKQAFNIRLTDDRPMLFYGLYEPWNGPKHDPLETFTIITTDANELTSSIHDRMPCVSIWNAEYIDAWLDPAFQNLDYLTSLLQPFASDEMETIAVSSYVNKVGNEGPQCIAAVNSGPRLLF
jgi:putative SOS response-associated peptidase YedK